MLASKIKTVAQLRAIRARLKQQGKRVVFTNGCFDLLHYGHVQYLEKARARGDALIVAINSDASVRRLKGPARPVVTQRFRARVLAALEAVDFVTIFSEATPFKVIQALTPDVLVKGGDWKKKDIVGSDVVEAAGGKVFSIPFAAGFSTSGLIKKIAHAR